MYTHTWQDTPGSLHNVSNRQMIEHSERHTKILPKGTSTQKFLFDCTSSFCSCLVLSWVLYLPCVWVYHTPDRAIVKANQLCFILIWDSWYFSELILTATDHTYQLDHKYVLSITVNDSWSKHNSTIKVGCCTIIIEGICAQWWLQWCSEN